MGGFTIFRQSNGNYRFNLKATNGQIILAGDGYSTKNACLDGIKAVQQSSPLDSRYERLTAPNGNYYFRLKAANGMPLGFSEMYVSEAGRENGIESVKKNGVSTDISDFS